jgi:hypothetical protein
VIQADLAGAADFIWCNARLVERRLYAYVFLGAAPEGVVAALRGYQNDDGGFGHALEPDLRGPESQPIHVETAFRALEAAGTHPPEMVARACSWLASVDRAKGCVPAIFESAAAYPRAGHWQPAYWTAESPNPTAAIAGLLHAMNAGHPWLDRADTFCWRRLGEPISDAHSLRCAFTFLEHHPDRRRAEALLMPVAEQIVDATLFALDPGVTEYALTPLDFAPHPTSMARPLFADALIDAHLDDLASRQQPDGGWPVVWEPPSMGAMAEWRARVTLDAISTLRAYGRI